ncbi:MAG: hypothetical protein E7408_02100 [Ruminococcaceae bacterium]|nr:hypothetical protein [Oscillospiraceae bacterium]
MKERHMFAGVNTPQGFFSRFDHIMSEGVDSRKIFIKGGPGMGKSTLMKKIVKRAGEEGLDCEIFHCSSDPSSVDGVHIPALKTAIVDATAPHNSDPVYPCIGGAIFDVSVHVDKEKLHHDPDEIIFQTMRKKRAFARGYHFLAAALPLLRQLDSEYMESTDVRGIYVAAEKLASRVLGSENGAGGQRPRELFVSAITPEGFVNYADSVFANTYCIAVKGSFGTSLFVRRFAELARLRGFETVCFYCPMRPNDKMEHVYIPALRVSLTTYDYYTHASAGEIVELDEYIEHISGIGDLHTCAGALMQRAIDAFAEAKTAHSLLESVYVPAMDFESLETRSRALIDSIF